MGTGEGGFGRVNGRGSGGEDSVGEGTGQGLLDGRSVEGSKGGPVVIRGHDAICEEGRDSGKEAGLKGGPNGAGARRGSDSGERRMRWLESACKKLGAEK